MMFLQAKKELQLIDDALMDELISGIKNREAWAISILYDKYASSLYGIIINLVRDEHLGKDILQNVFIKICFIFINTIRKKAI